MDSQDPYKTDDNVENILYSILFFPELVEDKPNNDQHLQQVESASLLPSIYPDHISKMIYEDYFMITSLCNTFNWFRN